MKEFISLIFYEKTGSIILKQMQGIFKQLHTYNVIRKSGIFDIEYYLKNNLDVTRSCMNPILHYLRHGWHEGRNPNKFFDTKWYLSKYRDVAESGMNPLYHYCKFGWKENRNPSILFSTKKYLSTNKEITNNKTNPLAHILKSELYKNFDQFRWSYRISEAQLLSIVRDYNAQKSKRKAGRYRSQCRIP